MDKKYELIETDKDMLMNKMYRVKAIKNFGDVRCGDVGGVVDSDEVLSQEGDCWICHTSQATQGSKITGNAQVRNSSIIFNSRLSDNVSVSCSVIKNSTLSGESRIIDSIVDYSDILYDSRISDSELYKTKIGGSNIASVELKNLTILSGVACKSESIPSAVNKAQDTYF